ncbi:MAG: CpaF family protein [Lachnospiraceae bacterium]|nr:CpaF family protein [Lachnospiraceae bacterium]
MMENYKEEIELKVRERLDLSMSQTDEDIKRIIDDCIVNFEKNLALQEKIRLRREIFNSFRRLDILTDYLEDDEVTEIMINGPNNIFIEKKGRLYKTNAHFESEEKLRSVIQQIVASCNRRINEADPIVDARIDNSRVNIVLNPISLVGPVVTIRKFSKDFMDLKKLSELGAFSPELIGVLDALVKAKYNIFISGGTGSGKTTFLNALSDLIPKDERIITIEDSAELKIRGIGNLVRLESRNSNVEGENSITIRDLIKSSLRMRPDRIIVGEVRDGAAADMLAAMNTGHDGSLSTGHANSAEDMISRLETMTLMAMDIPLIAIKKQIASAVDIIVHLGRMRDKSRKILKICEVVGMDKSNTEIFLNTLFEFVETEEVDGKIQGYLRKVNDMINTRKMNDFGLMASYKKSIRELSDV